MKSGSVPEDLPRTDPIRSLEGLSETLIKSLTAMGQGVVVSDGTRILWANEAVAKISGYSLDELEGMGSPIELLVEDDRRFVAEWAQRRQTGLPAPDHYETTLVRKDGRLVQIEVAVKGLQVEGRYRSVASIRDISENKRTMEALRDSEERLRTVLSGAPVVLFALDPDGVFTLSTGRGLESLGLLPGQVVGRSVFDVYQGNPKILDNVRRALAGEEFTSIVEADSRIFETRYSPLQGPTGEIEGAFGIAIDITDRKLSEMLVARLAAIVESCDEAIIGKNLDGTIESWNPAAERMYGYKAGEIVGNPVERLIPADNLEEFRKSMVRVHQGERIRPFRAQRLRKDGTLIEVSVSVSPILDAKGRVVGASSVARDMTEWRQAEEKIRRLNAELEQRVQERTAELEISNKELESFSYSVAHDLRAPLHIIDGYCQMLAEEHSRQLDADGTLLLERVRGSARHMGRLIEDLLNLSRLARRPLAPERVDLSALAQDVGNRLRESHPQREVEFVVAPNLIAEGDPSLLRILFENLLRNAWKFTGNNPEAHIEVGALRRDDEPVFFVRDDGAGFDMAYAHKLFRPFERLHRVAEFEGTGVGLATVQQVVQRHGGRAWAEGEVGRGATFYFTIGLPAGGG